MTEILLKVALNTINQTNQNNICLRSHIKGKYMYKKKKYRTINKFIAFHMKFMYRKLANQTNYL